MANVGTTIELADKYLFPTYKRPPFALVKGEGCRVWDENGKEYLDFVGGIAVCALGHSSAIVTKALEEQSRTLVHVSNLWLHAEANSRRLQAMTNGEWVGRRGGT